MLKTCPAIWEGKTKWLYPWYCTLDRGHTGDHEAHGAHGPCATWPKGIGRDLTPEEEKEGKL